MVEIQVFFETDSHAFEAAKFYDESTYVECLPALEKKCEEMGFDRVTESMITS